MRDKAQFGTCVFAVLLCGLTGCSKTGPLGSADAGSMPIAGHDAGPTPSHAGSGAQIADAAAPDAACRPLPCPSGAPWNAARCACVAPDAGASAAAECNADSDCGLVQRGCCGSCLPPTRDEVLAVPKSKLADVQRAQCPNPPNCGACYVSDPDPLAPLFAAACVAQRCELLDLRSAAISTCVENIDCVAVGRGCCPPYSADPIEYVGIHTGADAGILTCSPAPPCLAPEPHGDPLPFCAADGHCAVRRRETLHASVSFECFSPTQNLDHAYDSAAVGCDCVPLSSPLCRTDSSGRRVALICEGNDHWVAAEDGPCQQ